MMHTTHIVFSILITMLLYIAMPNLKSYSSPVLAYILAGFSATLPDIDHPKSFISRSYFLPISKIVEATTRHRGWTHSIFGTLIFTLIFLTILYYFSLSTFYAFFFFVGYISHLISDSLNPSGVNWLWPKKKRYGIGVIRTGSKAEAVFQVVVASLVGAILAHDLLNGYGRVL